MDLYQLADEFELKEFDDIGFVIEADNGLGGMANGPEWFILPLCHDDIWLESSRFCKKVLDFLQRPWYTTFLTLGELRLERITR